jgi:hypothetical protein
MDNLHMLLILGVTESCVLSYGCCDEEEERWWKYVSRVYHSSLISLQKVVILYLKIQYFC